MSNLSMVEAKLPPGFRFHPRDEELICDYLMKKVACCEVPLPLLIEVDLNKCEPWDIPEAACVGGKEWYFYTQRDRKYATGLRTNRATVSGYWKATGKDRPALRKGTLVGMRKTLVFYQGRAPKGRKTDWVMHEFRLEGPLGPPKLSSPPKEDWVLCRVFFKNRENIAKQDMDGGWSGGGCGGDNSTSSSYLLPALMDPYISFGQTQQTQTIYDHQYEQVPCFSISTPADQTMSYLTHMDPNFSTRNLPTFGSFPDFGGYLHSSTCDKKAIKAVLNQLTKLENDNNNHPESIKVSSSFGEASSESFLSEVALSTMWNQI